MQMKQDAVMVLPHVEADDRQPCLLRARVRQLVTSDGLLRLTDDVTIGHLYVVDLSTKTTARFINRELQTIHEKEVVQCAEDGGWIALECVDLLP